MMYSDRIKPGQKPKHNSNSSRERKIIELEQAVVKAASGGMFPIHIVKHYKCSIAKVLRILKKHGIVGKIEAYDAVEAKKMHETGYGVSEIAAHYAKCPKIIRRDIFKKTKDPIGFDVSKVKSIGFLGM